MLNLVNTPFKGGNRLDMVVELRVQYCRDTFFVVVIKWFLKTDSWNVSSKNGQSERNLKIEFTLGYQQQHTVKRLTGLKWIPKKFSTILHPQLNYHV